MRIAFLCKRRYMRHDVIEDRYARLYEIPRELARRSHDVLGVCLSYRKAPSGRFLHDANSGRLEWVSSNLGPWVVPGFLRYLNVTTDLLRDFRPDIIIGASDCLHILLARRLSSRLKVPYAVDLYDNFESFGLTRIPSMRTRYRHAVRNAGAVFCVSEPLSDRVRTTYRATGRVMTIESTINENLFKPRDRTESRVRLGLPTDVQLIGTAGALDYSRGIDRLYQAFSALSHDKAAIHLALAGVADRQSPILTGNRIHYLGQLSHTQIADFYAALDVGLVCVRETPFGRYSFPQKAYEMVAMRIPLVVAAVGAMEQLFSGYPDCLYSPDDTHQLTERIHKQLVQPVVSDIPIPTWADQAARIEDTLRKIATG
jgi:glycosyltransferase involved in cell wall biosynthesis